MFRVNYVHATGLSVTRDIGTIEKYLAANGIHSDVKNWNPMKVLLAQLRKDYPSKHHTKRAFRESELAAIFYRLQPKSINAMIIRCLLAFAVGGAFRASEYTAPCKKPTTKQTYNMVRGSRLTSFRNRAGLPILVYFFFKSKTNGVLKREFAVLPCVCDKALPCAYHEIEYLKQYIIDYNENTYLFTWDDGSYVTYRDALKVCKNVSSMIGANAEDIGTHSCRKARVVIGIKQGLPPHILMQLGRWQSLDSIHPYLRMEPQDLADAVLADEAKSPWDFMAVVRHKHHSKCNHGS